MQLLFVRYLEECVWQCEQIFNQNINKKDSVVFSMVIDL